MDPPRKAHVLKIRLMSFFALFWIMGTIAYPEKLFQDRKHFSEVLAENRNYRLFLPKGYYTSGKSYPVIYYFHGHSDRYTLEHYDNGTDTVPKIVDYVQNHDVIVVSVDGYLAENYTGFYGGWPWDIAIDGKEDFGAYFLELISHIDETLRTVSDRRHRGTSGLSMGGFMSLYLSGRYPDLIGSASSFNPGVEFYVGDPGRRVLWRPKDHVFNHENRWVRLIRASGDYISQYHEELRDAYARAEKVNFEYRLDEYHKHAATSVSETFDFHLKAFQDPTLNNVPEEWSYSSANSEFGVWGYQVQALGEEKGIVYLEKVRQGGLRIKTRRWAPDGPPLNQRQVQISTSPHYRLGSMYKLIDRSLATGETSFREIKADEEGRLIFAVDGSGHQISFAGPGTGAQPPVLLPVSERERLYVKPGEPVRLPVSIYNPRGEPMEKVTLKLISDYPTAEVIEGTAVIERIEAGAAVDVSAQMRVRFTSGGGYYSKARMHLDFIYDGWYEAREIIDVAIEPEHAPEPLGIQVLDGRSFRFHVFRQKGNQGGGASIEREVSEGTGNGNGILEPGEKATIWVKLAQGMDPFDKNNWYRCKVRTDSEWVSEVGDIQEQKQLEWTSARNRSSLIQLSSETPRGTQIPLVLENESWSYHYTPDVRYGTEPLYQAFQLHTYHLHRTVITVE
jgi:hypothetical protein